MGATGFVGSHVTRRLVEAGHDVRVYVRAASNTVAIDDLEVERHLGDLYDEAALRRAMVDRDVVYYCVVDTRYHLTDPAPLFETNVACLRRVLDIAAEASLQKFVFCSTIGTIAIGDGSRPVTEDMPFDWADQGGPYIESRRQAEDLVLEYARERGLPAVAMCVSNTFGPRDWQPNHGKMVQYAALGRMPAYIKGLTMEVVGIEDVAEAFLLAGERGTPGERYVISDRLMSWRELMETAATAVGARPPRIGIPLAVVYGATRVAGVVARLLGRALPGADGIRMIDLMPAADHGKATRELGWQPEPTAESIRRAAWFYVEHADELGG